MQVIADAKPITLFFCRCPVNHPRPTLDDLKKTGDGIYAPAVGRLHEMASRALRQANIALSQMADWLTW